MTVTLTPEHGARFELDLLEAEGGAARYRARVHLPGGHIELSLRIGPGGDCTIDTGDSGEGAAAPAWARAHLVALGKLLGRDAKREGTFRRRLLRWRQSDHGDHDE